MKAIRIEFPNEQKIKELMNLLSFHGFAISNPANTKGEYLDVIVKDKRRLAGMDMFLKYNKDVEDVLVIPKDELYLATDWIKDHELKYEEYNS